MKGCTYLNLNLTSFTDFLFTTLLTTKFDLHYKSERNGKQQTTQN